MKIIAWLSVLLLLLTIGGVAYLYTNANVTVASVTLSTQPAEAQAEIFDDCKARIANNAFLGAVFSESPLTTPDAYVFHTYTVTLKNGCFINADMVEIQVTPVEGDVLQFGNYTSQVLSKRSNGSFSATILTAQDNHPVREIIITYYMWGFPFRVETVFG